MIPEQIGQYRILAKIGEGGMGTIYRAEDPENHRQVAIKLISGEAVKDPTALKRFQREVEIASSLNHPHICTVYACGALGGSPYMVMELLEGKTLRDTLAGAPLPLERVLELGIQIADALDDAHEHGIVHRDVSSANIFVTHYGMAKVFDFGLAKICGKEPLGPETLERPISTVSTPGMTLGTTTSMSPEQVKGQELDRRSDVFSLGIVLFEMATGLLPFEGTSGFMVMHSILYKSPETVSQRNPLIPPELDRIIKKALEKDRTQRYRTAGELKADLVRLRLEKGRYSTASSLPSQKALAHPFDSISDPISAIDSWDAVACETRDFAERGCGRMYWYRMPLGDLSYPSGFRSSLQPALENSQISVIRFILDASVAAVPQAFRQYVLPLLQSWATRNKRLLEVAETPSGGQIYDRKSRCTFVSWIFADLSADSSPCFKLFFDDSGAVGEAEIHIATTPRSVRMLDGTQQMVLISDTILRARAAADPLLFEALRRTVSRWDARFP